MNIIVTNKYKDLIYGTNIEIMKELTGVFSVSEIYNSFQSVFYKKIIIDATAIKNFPKSDVIKDLATKFDTEKLILFLPPDNPAPKKFYSFLVSLNIYNFTDNSKGLIELVKRSNTLKDVEGFIVHEEIKEEVDSSNDLDYREEIGQGRFVIGIRSMTNEFLSTEIIYLLKKDLEENYQKKVYAVELDKREFFFYNQKDMYSISKNKLKKFLDDHLYCDILLIDLGNNDDLNSFCNDIIYIVEPSLYQINRLLLNDREAFQKLKGKKIVFMNSLLSPNEENQFAKEAGISIYYTFAPLNDRIHNSSIDKFLSKLGIIEESGTKPKKGLFDIFK